MRSGRPRRCRWRCERWASIRTSFLLSRLPSKYEFVFKDNAIPHSVGDKRLAGEAGIELSQFDAFLVCDTGHLVAAARRAAESRQRLGACRSSFSIIISHREDWADFQARHLRSPPAAGEIAGRADRAVGYQDRQADGDGTVPRDRIRYRLVFNSATRAPFTMRLAATLMEAGADTR